jgi:hypothetical protein
MIYHHVVLYYTFPSFHVTAQHLNGGHQSTLNSVLLSSLSEEIHDMSGETVIELVMSASSKSMNCHTKSSARQRY